jgi:hypothetical protein
MTGWSNLALPAFFVPIDARMPIAMSISASPAVECADKAHSEQHSLLLQADEQD